MNQVRTGSRISQNFTRGMKISARPCLAAGLYEFTGRAALAGEILRRLGYRNKERKPKIVWKEVKVWEATRSWKH